MSVPRRKVLPEEVRYDSPTTNMKLVEADGEPFPTDLPAHPSRMKENASGQQDAQPLRIAVPSSGRRLAFEKLYANQAAQEAWFSVSYRRP